MNLVSGKQQIDEAVSYISKLLDDKPVIGLILGSGLGVLANSIEQPTVIHYSRIPHFPKSTVEGHAGELVIGKMANKTILVMKGRFHAYEGYGAETVAFPVRVMQQLGVQTLLITNAAGGINEKYAVGDLMMITDHINMTGRNPLIGANDPVFGERFPDMSQAYSKRLRHIALEVAKQQNIHLQQGIYAGLLGPSYETPAEIRMLRILGADAVGMSTVPEVIVARHAGLEVLGFSCISNMAAGMLDQPLSHEEVMETTERVKPQFLQLILGIIAKI
jgi:purine-nucleoside phosphorylase